MFVTVDGPNGVGKSTIVAQLAEALQQRGHAVTQVREPSQSDVGVLARQHEEHLVGMPLAALVIADRYWQIETEIKPVLAQGGTVISDRYVAATLVLQRLDGLSLDLLWEMSRCVIVPDLSVLLAADAATLASRLSTRDQLSRFEKMARSAEQELAHYADAARLLRDAGYRLLSLDTDTLDVGTIIDRIVEEIAGI